MLNKLKYNILKCRNKLLLIFISMHCNMKKVVVLISENSDETKFCFSISFDMEDSTVYSVLYN